MIPAPSESRKIAQKRRMTPAMRPRAGPAPRSPRETATPLKKMANSAKGSVVIQFSQPRNGNNPIKAKTLAATLNPQPSPPTLHPYALPRHLVTLIASGPISKDRPSHGAIAPPPNLTEHLRSAIMEDAANSDEILC